VTPTRQLDRERQEGLGTRLDRLAVFDLDRTLIRGASLAALVRELGTRGFVTRRQLVWAGFEQALYTRRGSTDAQIERVRGRALALIAGMDREPLLAVAELVADRLVATITPAARFLLDHHLAGGHFCVLLSASPQELVERIGLALGIHRSIGTRAALVDERYTGGLDGPLCYGTGKVEALRLALGEIDLGAAFAYADSASDLPLLRACGHPVAVNPDRALRRVAQLAGWPVLILG
jgi:HAD superfamily hydrolase (TIGR01490 family)